MFITNSTSLSIDRLKILMKRHEMDRTAYAEYLDIPSNTLQAWENNTLKPSFIELVKLAAKEHITLGWLTGEDISSESQVSEVELYYIEHAATDILMLQKKCEEATLTQLLKGKKISDDPELIKNNLELDRKLISFCEKVRKSKL